MFNLGAAAPPDKSGLVDLPHCFHVLDTLEKDRTNLLVSVELFYNQSQSMIESWSKLLLSLSEVVMNSPNNNPIGKEYIETFQKSSNADLKIFANYIEASISPLIHQLKGLQVQYEGLKKKKKKLKHSTTTKGVGALLAVEFQQQINSAVTNRDFALWRFCKSNFDSKMKYAFEAHIQYSSVQGSFRKLSSKLMKMKKDSDKSSSNEAWNNSLRRSKELSISAFFQNRKIDEKDESSRYINPDELKRLGGEGNFWSLDNVMSLSRYSSRRGVLHITTYRMVFLSYGIQSSQKGKIESPSEVVFDIPLALIGRLEEIDQNDDFQIVQIFCKDLRNLVISFTQSKHSVNEFITNVSSLVFANTKALFAYFYRDPIDNSTDGWSLYDPHNEYKRLGIPDENFRITSINADYSLSPSYPSVLVVPMGISDADIKQAAPFRSKKRIISICWRLIGSNLAIARCSQPLVGVVGRRNSKDEAFLSEISRMATQQSNHRGLMLTGIGHGNFRSSPQSHIMILDARPKVNAVANLASGGGWENVEDLHTEVQFLNIDNIHVVRESLETMRKLFLPGVLETDYLVETHPASNLFTLKDWVKRYQDIQNTLRRSTQSSSWFRLLQTLLSGAIQIAQFIDMESNNTSFF